MAYDPNSHHRRSLRLRGHDYAEAGAYFITICAERRACLLSTIAGGEVQLSAAGEIVQEEWLRTADIRPRVRLDVFVIMPNHLHAILEIAETRELPVGAYCNTPLREPPGVRSLPLRSPSQTLGAIIRGFKSATTRRVNALRRTPGARFWQRNYYEHIIRDEADLARLREYIACNAGRWAEDEENPANIRVNP
ncbi:MAG: transposase [Anaerolineae bacterium]|nr:transposase [Anaerolineae bacterium]